MGFSGLAFFGFLITHLAANSLLLLKNPDPFNEYAFRLHNLGEILYILEAGLLAVFVLHVITAIAVTAQNRRARLQAYGTGGDAGGASKKSFASRSMIYTGLIILVFTIGHVWMFKFGPGIEAGYVTELHGQEARDLHRLVYEKFQNPAWVAAYVAVMIVLGLHLRHGIWSGLQSLGIAHPKYSPRLYQLGTLVAAIMAVGFLILPVYIYLRGMTE
jgi:succinate dehydrogenase / fumarate reductase, cytochrome b subunit